jgi:hypothetical protein
VPVLNLPQPAEGPIAIPVLVDLTGDTAAALDLSEYIENTQIFGQLQGVYIDCSNTPNGIVVLIANNNFRIVANGHTQGFYQVLGPRPTKLFFQRVQAGPPSGPVSVFLLNFPVQPGQWTATL